MSDRSLRSGVRNPILELPAVRQIMALPPEGRSALAALLRDLSKEARQRAEKSWRQSKAPMAAYWKAVSVYAGHTARAIRPQVAAASRARAPNRGAGR